MQGAYVEVVAAGTSSTRQTLSSSAQVIISAASTDTAPGQLTTPTITWNTPAAIPYGTALSSTQLNATANVPGTFAYTPAAGTVLNAGAQTLTATFTPTDTSAYSTATATVQLTVSQATPVITWPAPAAIVQGTALSSAQLDATANVPGTFSYNPAAGALLGWAFRPDGYVFTVQHNQLHYGDGEQLSHRFPHLLG